MLNFLDVATHLENLPPAATGANKESTLIYFIKILLYYCIKSGVLCIVEYYEMEID